MMLAEAVDVAIIGGGANGTGLARDLSLRGLTVALFEKSDFASGATGASSGMIHGGPRYLLDDVKTTRDACTDAGYILKMAPHLCFRIPFLMPVPRVNPFGPLGVVLHDVFFSVYDRYAGLKGGLPHARMDVHALMKAEPGLRGDFLGGVSFDEWGIDVGRLCLLNALDAKSAGAKIYTYHEVVKIERDEGGRASGVWIRPHDQPEPSLVKARAVVNCGGPWAEALVSREMRHQGELGANQVLDAVISHGARLRPGKGVHLIYDKRLSNFAVVTAAKDGRQIFVMPYLNETWIGTTDDDYYGDLDDLTATADEIAYLQEAGEAVLPALRGQRMIGTRVGVRNTIFGWGVLEDALSRRHETIDHGPFGVGGFFSVIGGKLASFRVQAEEAADMTCRYLGHTKACTTATRALPGGATTPDAKMLAKQFGVGVTSARRLVARHGALAEQVLALGQATAGGLSMLDPAEPTLECEVRYCCRHEHVVHLGDLMMRCRVGMGADMGMLGGPRAAQIMAEEQGLDTAQERQQLAHLLERRWRSARPIIERTQAAQMELSLGALSPLMAGQSLSVRRS